MTNKQSIRGVPVNVITGFLGVGKTTAIRHLLRNRPADERWAVLVNEFGEVGVDGELLDAERNAQVFIREVPGGCMCCAAGLPMRVALNQLLSRARPHRLLIEPTGLGHPREVLEALSENVRAGVLELRATLTLVDARCIEDDRYLRNETFQQQLEVADVVVANKSDLYIADELQSLERFIAFLGGGTEKPVYTVAQGQIEGEWLQAPSGFKTSCAHGHDAPSAAAVVDEAPLPESGYTRLENTGEGFHSCGWRFAPEFEFDYDALFSMISGMEAERVKGIFITAQGVFGFNKAGAVLTVLDVDDALESRVEVIDPSKQDWSHLEKRWLDTIQSA